MSNDRNGVSRTSSVDIGQIHCGMGRELLWYTREMFRSVKIGDSNPGTVDSTVAHLPLSHAYWGILGHMGLPLTGFK